MEKYIDKNSIEIYENEKGKSKVEVLIAEDTVWLSQEQIAEIFDKDRTVITKHINNIFKHKELDKSVCANFTYPAPNSKTYSIKCYNLDMIISIGYRVNSKRGVQFRRWASTVLKDHLIQGYSLNKEKLAQDKVKELQDAIDLMSKALVNNKLVSPSGEDIIEIIQSYSKTWDLLIKYDTHTLEAPHNLHNSTEEIISYTSAKNLIARFKFELQATLLFGLERGDGLKAILGNIMQSFGEADLYPSIEEKAAHLLYFVIKDHPFVDGNKRIGSLLFLLYLKMSRIDIHKMNDNLLTALALLTAESEPKQKDLVIRLIMNLI